MESKYPLEFVKEKAIKGIINRKIIMSLNYEDKQNLFHYLHNKLIDLPTKDDQCKIIRGVLNNYLTHGEWITNFDEIPK